MIPSMPHATQSRAEKRIFDGLREAFEGQGKLSPVAFHSLRLTRHPTKRFGEIDFLICGLQGIYVLEVKGGGVSCQVDRWKTVDESGRTHELRESPFRQAESAMHGLLSRLRKEIPEVDEQFTIGYGVVFPDCPFSEKGSEWERAMFADERDIRDLENWLKRFFRYWQDRDVKKRKADPAVCQQIYKFLRPDFDVAVPLHVLVRDIEENVVSLTEDQMSALDIIDANPRVLCHGGAGTGKTFLAMELARRWTNSGLKVALVCRSPWLKRFLETRFQIPGLFVALADKLETALRRADVQQFDAMIVDEGQDLFEMTILDRLDAALADGLSEGKWCIFHDINNQSGLFGEVDADAYRYLETLGPAKVPLLTNCRNTLAILEKVQTDLGADMGVRGTGKGPAVRQHEATSIQEAASIVEKELAEFIDRGGLPAGNITILSPVSFEESCLSMVSPRVREDIVVLDEFSPRIFPPCKVSFAGIAAFKGLENEVIILVDLPVRRPNDSEDSWDTCLRYVGMSRARAVLSIVTLASDGNVPLANPQEIP